MRGAAREQHQPFALVAPPGYGLFLPAALPFPPTHGMSTAGAASAMELVFIAKRLRDALRLEVSSAW